MKRRGFLMLSGAALSGGSSALGGRQPAGPAAAKSTQAQKSSQQQPDIAPDALLLKDYRPRSIFKIPATSVEKAKYPVIEMHNHGARGAEGVATTVRVMNAVNFEKAIIFLGFQQYHWPLSAFHLPDPILKGLYRDNALRALSRRGARCCLRSSLVKGWISWHRRPADAAWARRRCHEEAASHTRS